MTTFRTVITISTLALAATLVAAPARAQSRVDTSSGAFTLGSQLTEKEFEQFASDVGSALRFRQLGDTTTLGRGNVEVGMQFANTPTMSNATANDLGRTISFPQIVARVGASDRVDVGAWGGLHPNAKYGVVGVDTKIALLREGPGLPVSLSIRPSVTALIAPSQVLVGNASVDVTISRAFGKFSPYAGLAASTLAAVERSAAVEFDPVSTGSSLSYAGLSYRWRMLALSGEVQRASAVSYAFRVGTRF